MEKTTAFAPQLYIPNGITDTDFYKDAFGAEELRRFKNDDGTVHVVEFSIDGQLFHLHEQNAAKAQFAPDQQKGISVMVGLFVSDVDRTVANAEKAGARILQPPRSYDYGYRQAELRDPFGHVWLIESKI